MKPKTSRKLGADRLRNLKPKSVGSAEQSLVASRPLSSDDPLPLLVEPVVDGVDLGSWLGESMPFVEKNLLTHGGLLFRGFGIGSVARFNALMDSLSDELMEYRERSAPRTQLEGRVYTSTEYPQHQRIAFHNEFSYALSWPRKIGFCCLVEPGSGGETPIADSRKVYAALPEALRREFERRGVMYVRNYGGGVDLSWQEVFQTEDRPVVEEYCRRAPMEFEWLDGDRLRTRARRPATTSHPDTGEPLWFNQAHLFHVSNLEPSVRDAMLASFAEEDLPRNTCYGDGSAIPGDVLDAIRTAYDEVAVAFPWRHGDFLLLDNMLVAHGRNPFTGERTIAVAMAQPYSAPSVASPVATGSD